MLGTLNMMNSSELNSLMSHIFKIFQFYPITSYLLKTKTLNFILWTPLEQPNAIPITQLTPKEDLAKASTSVLKELRWSNMEIEQLLAELVELDVEIITLGKLLWKEFNEIFSSVIIPLFPLVMKVLNLTLGNSADQVIPAVALTP